MTTLTLKYVEGSTTRSRNVNVLAVKGLTTPDMSERVGTVHQYLDGNSEQEVLGFKKVIMVDFGVVSSREDKAFVGAFLTANKCYVATGDYEDEVVAASEEFVDEWLEDVELGKRFVPIFKTVGKFKRWSKKPTETEIMYLKSNVEVVGTESNPEQFETNVGKLLTDDTGNPFPTFNASTHVHEVAVHSRQEAIVHRIDTPTVVGGNLRFKLAVQDAGKPSADGKFYCDISITLQVRP